MQKGTARSPTSVGRSLNRLTRQSRGRAVCIGSILILLPAAASAQTENEDFQVWTYATISAPLSSRVDATIDLHAELTDDAERASQYLVRPNLSFKLDDRFAVGGGYARSAFPEPAVRPHVKRPITWIAHRPGPDAAHTTIIGGASS